METKARYYMPRPTEVATVSFAELKARAKAAAREKEGPDFGPMSHAERNKILFGI